MDEWKVENEQSKLRAEVQKTQNLLDETDIRPVADHLDKNSKKRDWNEKTDRLKHEATEKGAGCNSFMMMERSTFEAVRACVDGGGSKQDDRRVKQKSDRPMSSKHLKELRKLLRRWNGEQ